VEPEIVLLWHHSEEPFSVPGGTFIFPCASTLHYPGCRSAALDPGNVLLFSLLERKCVIVRILRANENEGGEDERDGNLCAATGKQ